MESEDDNSATYKQRTWNSFKFAFRVPGLRNEIVIAEKTFFSRAITQVTNVLPCACEFSLILQTEEYEAQFCVRAQFHLWK